MADGLIELVAGVRQQPTQRLRIGPLHDIKIHAFGIRREFRFTDTERPGSARGRSDHFRRIMVSGAQHAVAGGVQPPDLTVDRRRGQHVFYARADIAHPFVAETCSYIRITEGTEIEHDHLRGRHAGPAQPLRDGEQEFCLVRGPLVLGLACRGREEHPEPVRSRRLDPQVEARFFPNADDDPQTGQRRLCLVRGLLQSGCDGLSIVRGEQGEQRSCIQSVLILPDGGRRLFGYPRKMPVAVGQQGEGAGHIFTPSMSTYRERSDASIGSHTKIRLIPCYH